ncbi:DUF3108 domain-containing protein [Phaeovulum veldkampii]|nr:DUF3108 domain-containing protein [Phaeovulum veldkampii]TDQ56110.1 uncharacterized protein DUF3108 [Phaeovulum veldkampii DSM 11550]
MTMPSRFPPRAGVLALAALLSLSAAPLARADQSDQMVFDLTLKGLTAGRLSVSGRIEGGSYAAKGTLQSAGLIGALRKVRYDADVSGSVRATRFTPARYAERADTGKRESESVMDYKAGVPQVRVYNPPRQPRPGDIAPATQGGTIDPLTALYATLRDVPAAQACNSTVVLFDGRRRSQVTLAAAKADGEGLQCAGEYRRLAGFSDKEMADKTRFPFRLVYKPAANGMMRVVEVSMDTIYGKGALKRR